MAQIPSPRVSVVLPVYNGARYLSQAIDSILAQSLTAFEFLIVDDGSTDDSAAIADRYAAADNRIRIIRMAHAGNGHAAAAGLIAAAAPFVARMDHDDIAAPTRLEKQLDYMMAHPNVAVVGAAVRIITEGSQRTNLSFYPETPDEVREWLARGYVPVANPTAMLRKAQIMTIGGVRTQFTCANDYDLWLRVGERYDIANLQEALLDYRVHGHNISHAQRFEQALCVHIAKLSAEARVQGKPDPVNSWKRIEFAHLDAFEMAPPEAAFTYTRLAKTALYSHALTADPRYLDAAEACLGKLDPTTNRRALRTGLRTAWRRARRGEIDQSLATAKWCWSGRMGRPGQDVAPAVRRKDGGLLQRTNVLRTYRSSVPRLLIDSADPAPRHDISAASVSPAAAIRLVAEAHAHGVLPAVMRNLAPRFEDDDFAEVRAAALLKRRETAAFTIMLRQHADHILAAARDLPVTMVKGRAFAEDIYPHVSMRGFTDVDLLAAPSAIAPLEDILRAQGFQFVDWDHDPARLEAKWIHKDNPTLLVEVHSNLVHHPGLRRRMSLAYDDFEGAPRAPAAHLMIAIMHGALHQYERLRQMVDILQAARALRTRADEAQFERLVARSGGHLAATVGLNLAARMFDEPRCRDIARALGHTRHMPLAKVLISRRVVTSTMNAMRPLHTWRRKAFRSLLKRGAPRGFPHLQQS